MHRKYIILQIVLTLDCMNRLVQGFGHYGAFLATKDSRNFETGAKGREISWKSFRKIRKLLNFRNASHLTGMSREKPNGSEIFDNLVNTFRVCLLFRKMPLHFP